AIVRPFGQTRFPGSLPLSIRPIATGRADREIRRAEIPIVRWSTRSACRRQNRLSMEVDADLVRRWTDSTWRARAVEVRAAAPDKIAPFANDRAILCRRRNKDRCAHKMECERKCAGSSRL